MIDIDILLKRLAKHYPDPKCALNFGSPYELLFATILSAQCTDKRVNQVTAGLFKKYKKLSDYYNSPLEELEEDVKTTGFFRHKALAIRESAERIDKIYNGEVPKDMDSLLTLRGVARKTANVVLGNAFNISVGVVVDTHVSRLSGRLTLTSQKIAERIEKDLMKIIPQDEWIDFSHRLILHGREVCKSRKPRCQDCFLNDICPSVLR